jgi:hypothetical protein
MVCERCHDGSEWIPKVETVQVNKKARKISRLKATIVKLRAEIKEQQETIDGLNFRLMYDD